MIIGMWIGYKLKDNIKSPQNFFTTERVNTLQEVVEIISHKYTDSLNTDTLKIRAINNLLYQLDPYSTYIYANKLQSINDKLSGNFKGIGIEFQVIKDTLNILQVLEDGPAKNAGLQVGDKLLKIDDISTTGSNIIPEKIKELLQTEKKSTVELTVLHNTKILSISIKKGFVPIKTIDAAYKLDSTTGYIRINRFAETTYAEFMQALEKLNHNNIKKLVIDLRDNGGGLLDQAAEIADELLDDEKLIVYTQGAHLPRIDYNCKRNGLFEKGKLIVLVNKGTASAAEILAGSLQDWDRATIVGATTFGKGLVQEQFYLSDGAAIRLTVAKYYLPTGRNIQKNHKANKNNIINDDTIYKTLAGHAVYGGRGIIPDISVPTDSLWNTSTTMQLLEKNIITKYAYEYFLTNRNTIISYKTIKDFANQYTLLSTTWNNFINYAKQNGVDINNFSLALQKETLHRIKALLARFIWENEGFYEVYNTTDIVIQKAMMN